MNFSVSPHTMVESYLTASTLSTFIKRALELKRTHFACTDHGFLYSSLKAYNACKEAKIKPILGLQFYFKDPVCEITTGTLADRCKYFSATIYAEDQEAYQAICQLISRTDFQTIEIREEKQNLLTWSDLFFLSKYKTNLVIGGIHDLVGKTYLASDASIALKVFEKLNNLFKNRLRVAIIAEPWSKKYARVVEIKYKDGTRDTLLSNDYVSTNRARRIFASDLEDRAGHNLVKSIIANNIYTEINKEIDLVKSYTGFLPLPCDASLKINKFLILLANRYEIPILVSDYAYYAYKDDKIVQHVVLEGKDKTHASQNMKTKEEIVYYLEKELNLDIIDITKILINNEEWAKLFDKFELKYEWRLASSEDKEPLAKAMEIIKRNGRMKWDNPVYVERLKYELNIIAKNVIKDLTPYFLPIVEVMDYYKSQKQLASVRGSAGGSLFCYLLGITNIDPIPLGLPFNRFLSKIRIEMKKLPDIDIDLPQKETLIGKDGRSGFLYERWGKRVGHISTRQTVRLRSAIKDVERYLEGKVSKETENFTAGLPQPPQGISDRHFVFGYENEEGEHVPGIIETNEDLKKYASNKPKCWEIVCKAMGITRAFSKHACAMVISDVPLDQVIPIKEGYITHYEHKEVEAAGLVKMDFLTIDQLLHIQVCLQLINKRNGDDFEAGYFTHKGKKTYIWDLPKEEEVYKSIWNGDTVSLFQINSTGMSELVKKILPNDLLSLASILALERPGPKDYIDPETGRSMVEEYVLRRKGESKPDIKELAEILPESYGTFIYQEDLGKVAKNLAGFNDEDAEILREKMAKKKMVELTKIKPTFIAGATKKVTLEVAEKIWEQMVTFGRYGFSIIHSYEYAMITYACMFLRQNYNLDWWSAVLTNSTENKITSKYYPHTKHLLASPDINLSTDEMVPDYANNKIRSKLGVIKGMGEATIEPLVANRPYKDIQDFVDKDVCGRSLAHKLTHVGVLDSLYKPNSSFLEKLKAYEDALEIKIFRDKKKEAEKKYKSMRALQPKDGQIPEEYLNLHPLKDAAMRKSVLPTLYIDLHSLGCKYSKILDEYSDKPKVVDSINNKSVFLVDGPTIERLDNYDNTLMEKDVYVAATCFVVKVEEFSYSKGTKRALKLVVDCGGNYITEKVLWPDYNSGELDRPVNLKKGCIATIFMKKSIKKRGEMSITKIFVET